MKAFTYERARTPGRSGGAAAAPSGRALHRRRHQPARPDEAGDRDAAAPDRRQRPGLDKIEADEDGGLRIGALVRNTDLAADARVRRDYAVLSRACWPAPRPSCATRRPRPATCCSAPAARISTTPTSPATSAFRAAAARPSAATRATTRSSAQRGLHRHPSERHGGGHAAARRRCRDGAPDGSRARDPDRRLLSPAGQHAAYRNTC
jgi:hypothetical protein